MGIGSHRRLVPRRFHSRCATDVPQGTCPSTVSGRDKAGLEDGRVSCRTGSFKQLLRDHLMPLRSLAQYRKLAVARNAIHTVASQAGQVRSSS